MQERDWDATYLGREAVWSGEPNPQLVAEVADMPLGRALDLGCGEGADAVWLAARGWKVTAIDISQVALNRARRTRSGFLRWPVRWNGGKLTPP